jgi:hypothetical protein
MRAGGCQLRVRAVHCNLQWPTVSQPQYFGCPILRVFCEGWDVDHDTRHLDYEDEERRAFEWRRREEGRREWAKRRVGKSLSHVIDQMREDTVSDSMMNRYLQEEGLLAKQAEAGAV